MPLTIADLSKTVMDLARAKGFGTKPKEINVAEKITLIHSELSEAYDAYRHKKMSGRDGFNEELADVIMRTVHLAGIFNIDLEKEIKRKIGINKKRTWSWKKMNEKHR